MRRVVMITLIAVFSIACQGAEEQDECPEWRLGEVVDTEGCGTLARLPGPWGDDLWIVRVQGTPYEMGYQYGRLLGPTMEEMWDTYMGSLAEGAEVSEDDDDTLMELIGELLDLGWEWFEPHISPRFHRELEGVVAGMKDSGVTDPEMEAMPRRIITLVELAMSSQLSLDDLSGITSLLNHGVSRALREYYDEQPAAVSKQVQSLVNRLSELQIERIFPPLQCSFYAAWGDRTDHGGLYATRNMDFTPDTGIGRFASIAVFVPNDGIPYTSISWVGANLGGLAGMSREGLTISAVGASSPLERIDTQPALFKAREVLEGSVNLEEAMSYMDNTVDDGFTRAPTIGYNALVAWGDPRGGGASAGGLMLENNGLSSGAFLHHSDCSVDTMLVRFDRDGTAVTHTPGSRPEKVNTEAEAVEIDANANPLLFAHDGTDYILDDDGNYIEDPDGMPLRTGYPLPCALYRGDEALAHGVRMHQYACNGPQRENPGLMVRGGSYRNRYTPMREMTEAWEAGEAWSWDGEEIIPCNDGVPAPVTMDGAEAVSRVAAMRSNTWDVVYDATDLVMRLSYESGTGDDWVAASDQPEFLEVSLDDLILVD